MANQSPMENSGEMTITQVQGDFDHDRTAQYSSANLWVSDLVGDGGENTPTRADFSEEEGSTSGGGAAGDDDKPPKPKVATVEINKIKF